MTRRLKLHACIDRVDERVHEKPRTLCGRLVFTPGIVSDDITMEDTLAWDLIEDFIVYPYPTNPDKSVHGPILAKCETCLKNSKVAMSFLSNLK